jgi:hypothetical protein
LARRAVLKNMKGCWVVEQYLSSVWVATWRRKVVKRGQLKSVVLIAGRDRVQKQCAWWWLVVGLGWEGDGEVLAIRQKSLKDSMFF